MRWRRRRRRCTRACCSTPSSSRPRRRRRSWCTSWRIWESYASSDEWRDQYEPVAAPISNELFELFSPNVYEGESVGTDEFIELAERISRRDLSRFAQEWLYSTTVPPMPGHPDWELDPAGADAPAPQARSQAMQLERMLHKR
jgi:hypothetical protein